MCKDCFSKKNNIVVRIEDENTSAAAKKLIKQNICCYIKRFKLGEGNNILLEDAPPNVRRSAGKRFRITINEEVVDFGLYGAETFVDLISIDPEQAIKKKISYTSRASKIVNKEGEYTYKIKFTPNSFAYWILWFCKNCL